MQHLHHCYAKSAVQVPFEDDYLSITETNPIQEDYHEPDPRFP